MLKIYIFSKKRYFRRKKKKKVENNFEKNVYSPKNNIFLKNREKSGEKS